MPNSTIQVAISATAQEFIIDSRQIDPIMDFMKPAFTDPDFKVETSRLVHFTLAGKAFTAALDKLSAYHYGLFICTPEEELDSREHGFKPGVAPLKIKRN